MSLEVSINIESDTFIATIPGVTQVVNLHGALIRTEKPLTIGSSIAITVYLTGKRSPARVVHIATDDPLKAGIALDFPMNIWGVSLVPDDWDNSVDPR